MINKNEFDLLVFVDLSLRNLVAMLHSAAKLGANIILTENELVKPYITKADAIRMAGRNNVLRWIQEGLIELVSDEPGTAKTRIKRLQLETVMKTSNRPSYQPLNQSLSVTNK